MIVSFIGVSLAGISDITNKNIIVSKEHYWKDSLYLIMLAIWLLLWIFITNKEQLKFLLY